MVIARLGCGGGEGGRAERKVDFANEEDWVRVACEGVYWYSRPILMHSDIDDAVKCRQKRVK